MSLAPAPPVLGRTEPRTTTPTTQGGTPRAKLILHSRTFVNFLGCCVSVRGNIALLSFFLLLNGVKLSLKSVPYVYFSTGRSKKISLLGVFSSWVGLFATQTWNMASPHASLLGDNGWP